ncbi:hypothetical protein [Deinococcus planocerae]|uniref:hypothetical protein n=1 Tax=Deinococcus planocerae TaxID=1737569 RepID=UPI000C7F4272|nr:hypothetical protein [Deinococcus planocerae]
MPEASPNPTYSGHLGQPRYLQRDGQPLTPDYRYELPEDVPRVVSWGDQDHLTYAAHLLAFDLFRSQAIAETLAGDLRERVLRPLPHNQPWEMTREELLERIGVSDTLTFGVQGQLLTLPALAVSEEGYVRVLLWSGDTWLQSDQFEVSPQETAGQDSLPALFLPDAEDLAPLRRFAETHGLRLDEDHGWIPLGGPLPEVLAAFQTRAREALDVEAAAQRLHHRDQPLVPGEAVPVHRAVDLGERARTLLVRWTVGQLHVPDVPQGWTPPILEDRAHEAAQRYNEELRRLIAQLLDSFASSPHEVVRLQVAPGWYRVGDHVLRITGQGELRVRTLQEYVAWRNRRPYDVERDVEWQRAPDEGRLLRLVNVRDPGPPPTLPDWALLV